MAIKVIVFDFDGTLVDSNRLKYDAWFHLFPSDAHHAGTVKAVLARIGEASRYDIIAKILTGLGGQQTVSQHDIDTLADRYNAMVLDGVKQCPEIPGAGQMLKTFVSSHRLYVSSTTPEKPLKEIIHFRGWNAYFAGIFGYPAQKSATLDRIMETEGVDGKAVLGVGDGESDRRAARENGCHFLPVDATLDYHNFQTTIENIERNEA